MKETTKLKDCEYNIQYLQWLKCEDTEIYKHFIEKRKRLIDNLNS